MLEQEHVLAYSLFDSHNMEIDCVVKWASFSALTASSVPFRY